MRTLVLRLAGAQSWGGESTQRYRTTERIPTRSAVEGLLAAALGVTRTEQRPPFLSTLSMLVRGDRPGVVSTDFHTVTAPDADVSDVRLRDANLHSRTQVRRADYVVPLGNGVPWVVGGNVCTMLTERLYLADAEFMLAISGEDADIAVLAEALHTPVFAPYLGRLAYAPTFPFHLGTRDGNAEQVLRALPSTSQRPTMLWEVTATGPRRIGRVEVPHTTAPLHDWKPCNT